MPIHKVCKCCGREFTVPRRRSDEVKFCSRACTFEVAWVLHECRHCGVAVRRRKSDMTRSVYCYCSKACYFKASVGTPKRTALGDAGKIRKACEMCGLLFLVPQARKNSARWCSTKCQGLSPAWKAECSERQAGAKHWRWSGGDRTQKTGYVRHKKQVLGATTVTYPHREVITLALLKADPTHAFIEAGRLNSKIEVHHIDRDRSNNSLSNLLAVTRAAHARIHHQNQKPMPGECWPPNPPSW